MRSAAILFVVLVAAPLAVAVTAFFSGLTRASDPHTAYREDELGI